VQKTNTYLKRGEGKLKGNIKKNDFYDFYVKNSKEVLVNRPVYNNFIKELLTAFSTSVVEEGLELKVNRVGKLRVRSNPLKFFKKDGTRFKSLKVNWHETWAYWHGKHPGLSRQEITEIPNKKVIYHENDHSNQEFYDHYWDKATINLKFKSFYKFKASRQFSRLIAKVVKDPNRKVFYYG
jgi:hypothetical protein